MAILIFHYSTLFIGVVCINFRETYNRQKEDVKSLMKTKQASQSGLGPKVCGSVNNL